jgi:acetate kinase
MAAPRSRCGREQLNQAKRSETIAQLSQALVSGQTKVLAQLSEIDVVGHRVVNGGAEFTSPSLITPEFTAAIEKVAVFAPLHNRAELEGIGQIENLCAPVPQVAV